MEISYVCKVCKERITFDSMMEKYIDYYMNEVCFYCGKEPEEQHNNNLED